jgi:hypothetical protein
MKASLVYDERGVGRTPDGGWAYYIRAVPASEHTIINEKRAEKKERREELEMSRLRRRNAPKPLREELVRAVRRLGRKVERKREKSRNAREEKAAVAPDPAVKSKPPFHCLGSLGTVALVLLRPTWDIETLREILIRPSRFFDPPRLFFQASDLWMSTQMGILYPKL